MKAKEFMCQVQKLDRIIENKIAEKRKWQELAMGTTSCSNGDRVQSSGSHQKMSDAVCSYVDIESEIDCYIKKLIEKREEIINTIEGLEIVKYDVLHKIYVQGMDFSEIADIYNKSYSWVTTIHGRALKDVQKIIDERSNNG